MLSLLKLLDHVFEVSKSDWAFGSNDSIDIERVYLDFRLTSYQICNIHLKMLIYIYIYKSNFLIRNLKVREKPAKKFKTTVF